MGIDMELYQGLRDRFLFDDCYSVDGVGREVDIPVT